jgi:hypothetical protein
MIKIFLQILKVLTLSYKTKELFPSALKGVIQKTPNFPATAPKCQSIICNLIIFGTSHLKKRWCSFDADQTEVSKRASIPRPNGRTYLTRRVLSASLAQIDNAKNCDAFALIECVDI